MRTESAQLFYDDNGHHFTSRLEAAKSNLQSRFFKLKKERTVRGFYEDLHNKSSVEPPSMALLVIMSAEDMALPHFIACFPDVVETLLHGFYEDMGEHVMAGIKQPAAGGSKP